MTGQDTQAMHIGPYITDGNDDGDDGGDDCNGGGDDDGDDGSDDGNGAVLLKSQCTF